MSRRETRKQLVSQPAQPRVHQRITPLTLDDFKENSLQKSTPKSTLQTKPKTKDNIIENKINDSCVNVIPSKRRKTTGGAMPARGRPSNNSSTFKTSSKETNSINRRKTIELISSNQQKRKSAILGSLAKQASTNNPDQVAENLVIDHDIIKRDWKRVEVEWEKDMDADLKHLYSLKDYLVAGIHSSHYKPPELSNYGNTGVFRFSLPIEHGYNELLMEEKDFYIPEDILFWAEGKELIAPRELVYIPVEEKREYKEYKESKETTREISDHQSVSRKGGRPYIQITKSIFVERKPRVPIEKASCGCRPLPRADGDDEAMPVYGCFDSTCVNRALLIECDPEVCLFKENCKNQRFQTQSNDHHSLEVFKTEKRGHGLKTLLQIPAHSLVKEYCGEIISQETCSNRIDKIYKKLDNHYFLAYDDQEVVDACRKGTDARFVNHSCDPNCYIEKWQVGGEFRIGVYSNRDIEAGEELTYDYNFRAFGDMKECLCASEKCRGFLGNNKKSERSREEDRQQRKESQKRQRYIDRQHRALLQEDRDVKPTFSWHSRQFISELTKSYDRAYKLRSYFWDSSLLLVRNLNSGLLDDFVKADIGSKEDAKKFLKSFIDRRKGGVKNSLHRGLRGGSIYPVKSLDVVLDTLRGDGFTQEDDFVEVKISDVESVIDEEQQDAVEEEQFDARIGGDEESEVVGMDFSISCDDEPISDEEDESMDVDETDTVDEDGVGPGGV